MFILFKTNFLSIASKIFLFLLLFNAMGTKLALTQEPQRINSIGISGELTEAKIALTASELEQNILKEINRARTNPQEYAAWLESLKQYYKDNMFNLPGERPIRANRGLTVLEEAIAFVKEQSPLSPFSVSEDLVTKAKDKVTVFLGNRRNRDLENISYGRVTPEAIVMELIVDERYRDRRHRLAIFNPNYRLSGIACQEDRRFTQVCAIAYEVTKNDIVQEEKPSSETPPESEANVESESSTPSISRKPSLIEKTERGILEVGDKTIPNDGSLYDSYPLEGKAGDSFIISVESQDFDTFLAIMDRQGNIIEQNDDISDRNSNSRIKVTLPGDGTYNVIVNAYDKGGKGKYILTVRR